MGLWPPVGASLSPPPTFCTLYIGARNWYCFSPLPLSYGRVWRTTYQKKKKRILWSSVRKFPSKANPERAEMCVWARCLPFSSV